MTEERKGNEPEMKPVQSQWGSLPEDNFGYASDEERRRLRGLEDWEMVNSIPDSQARVPPWFFAVVAVVLLVAIGLSFPFWGDRPGYERSWINWGFGAALLYILVFGGFVWVMVNFYGSKAAGRLDSDKERLPDDILRDEKRSAEQEKDKNENP